MKQQKKLQELQNKLKKGQLVITNGGIHGKIVHADEANSWVKIDVGNTQLKVEKSSIIADGTAQETTKK